MAMAWLASSISFEQQPLSWIFTSAQGSAGESKAGEPAGGRDNGRPQLPRGLLFELANCSDGLADGREHKDILAWKCFFSRVP